MATVIRTSQKKKTEFYDNNTEWPCTLLINVGSFLCHPWQNITTGNEKIPSFVENVNTPQ